VSFLSKLFQGSVGKVVDKAGDVFDELHLSGEEKQKFKLEMEQLLMERDAILEATLRSELQAKERILVAELGQGDSYTKRARPTVVYSGLLFIFLNYCLLPLVSHFSGNGIPQLDLPTEFWIAFGGITSTWSIGRTFEKRGVNNKVISKITGSKQHSILLDRD
jgi:hypothetical protein